MIIEQEKQNVTTNIKKSSGFKIQASAKAFEILSSNIYTNKVKAVIREISCNAHDAHVAAKTDKKFKVHLPTKLEQWFSVRDYGPGIPEEKMEDIYTTYFYSDKTDTNDMIGGLGLGTKSPLCLVDSFTVINYNNGYKLEYCCFKNEINEPQITLLSKTRSDESSGLEVKISVSSNLIEEFLIEAVNIYRFFEVLPDINDQRVAQRIEEINKKIVWLEDFAINPNRETFVVMGNVAYSYPNSGYTHYLIKANIGDVNFDPGRENLTLDQKTKEFVKSKLDSIQKRFEDIARKELDAISCPFERGQTYLDKYQSFRSGVLSSKYIQKVPDYITHYKNYRYRSFRENHFDQSNKDNKIAYCISTKSNTSKIRHLLNNGYKYVYVLSNDSPVDYVPKDLIIDLDALKIPRAPRSTTPRVQPTYDVFEVEVDKIDSINLYNPTNLKKVDLNTIPKEERIVAGYKDNTIEYFSVERFSQIIKSANELGANISKFYIVDQRKIGTKKFNKIENIRIKDYLLQECDFNFEFYHDSKHKIDRVINGLKSIKSTDKFLLEKIEVLEEVKKKSGHQYLLSLLDKDPGTSIIDIVENELKEKHPIFKLLDICYLNDNEIKVLRSYL